MTISIPGVDGLALYYIGEGRRDIRKEKREEPDCALGKNSRNDWTSVEKKQNSLLAGEERRRVWKQPQAGPNHQKEGGRKKVKGTTCGEGANTERV